MKLYYTPIRNYVHTVEAVIHYAGLEERIEPIATQPFDPDSPITTVNPLGTVPALVLEDGACLSGELLVCEYLDSLHKRRKLFPAKPPQRWVTLRQAHLADGMLDALGTLTVESWLPREQQRASLIQRNWGRVLRGLDELEREVLHFQRLDIGQFRAVAVLQYLKVRMPEIGAATNDLDARFDFTAGHPHLAAWYKSMARKKLFRAPLVKAD